MNEILNISDDEQRPYKKFVQTFTFGDDNEEFDVLTDTGWSPIKSVGKTIEYAVWELHLFGRTEPFRCADKHSVYVMRSDVFHETFVQDLLPGDLVLTENGVLPVVKVVETHELQNMYDLQLADDNRRFYTSGILSHNSIWLANIAAKAVQQGHNCAVISLEMSEQLYIKRLGSNMLNIEVSEYKRLADDEQLIKKRLNDMSFQTLQIPGQLIVKEFPTSTASILDIEAYLKRVEELRKIKFKVVVIDYINILKNWRNPNSENTYMKIKQIAEDTRAMAQRNEWAVISATQTKQSAFDLADMSMGHASESSGLVATVDLMFGIIQDPLMHAAKKYLLKTLANRGEGYKNTKKEFDIDYRFMRIGESSAPMVEGEFFE